MSVYKHYKESAVATFLLHLIMIEFFFFSGEVYYTSIILGGGAKSRFIFLLTCIFYVYISHKKFRPSRINIRNFCFITIWVLLCTYVFGQEVHDLKWFLYIVFALSMFLVISTIDFDRFRNLLLRYLIWLSLISIIIQIGHDYFEIFPAKTYVDGGGKLRYLSLGIFTTEWAENRLASIFWEPGQYQIVILYVLILFADEWSNIAVLRKSLRRFGILIIALIMTLSTTAYLMLGLIVLTILVRSWKSYIKYIPILLLLSGFAIYSLYNSEAIQTKVEQSENENQRSSYTVRLADNLGCLLVTSEAPLTGFGPGSTEMENRLYSEGSETSSNGWLYSSAQLGIPYILFLWICIWRNLKQMAHYTNRFLLFLILLLSQANEYATYFPYMYMYIFSFKKETEVQCEKQKCNKLIQKNVS